MIAVRVRTTSWRRAREHYVNSSSHNNNICNRLRYKWYTSNKKKHRKLTKQELWTSVEIKKLKSRKNPHFTYRQLAGGIKSIVYKDRLANTFVVSELAVVALVSSKLRVGVVCVEHRWIRVGGPSELREWRGPDVWGGGTVEANSPRRNKSVAQTESPC